VNALAAQQMVGRISDFRWKIADLELQIQHSVEDALLMRVPHGC